MFCAVRRDLVRQADNTPYQQVAGWVIHEKVISALDQLLPCWSWRIGAQANRAFIDIRRATWLCVKKCVIWGGPEYPLSPA
jgi:hypothetical protein